MKKKILLGVVALALVIGVAVYVKTRPEPADTRFAGAYALADGTLVVVTPREGKVLRYRMMNGEGAVLWPTGDGEYEGGPGWDRREPVVNHVKFDSAGAGRPGFDWRRADDKVVHARRIDLPERTSLFPSGDIQLRGKLVLPDAATHGPGPFPAVVIVHGSESYSAVDYYFDPYLYAANGFAALAFDKRGTGESQGKYLQNFHVLSDDVVAAVRWLRTQPGIDGNRIHLAGFSQGGWIAPLAALKDGNIRSVLVGYGVMVPVTGEDRWGYFYALQQKGFGADAVAAADRVNAVIEDISRSPPESLERARQHARCGRARNPGSRACAAAIRMLGTVADTQDAVVDAAHVSLVAHAFAGRHAVHRPALRSGADDAQAPDAEPVDARRRGLERTDAVDAARAGEAAGGRSAGAGPRLPRRRSRHHQVREEDNGERRYIGLEPDYYPAQIAWLREHSGS